MRARDFAFLASLASLSFLACGGATEQDVLSASSSSSSSGTTTGTSSSSSSSSSGASGSSSGAPQPVADSGTKPPPASCEDESEPNDDPGDANKLETSICGVLSPGSETDYLTFQLEASTKSMSLTFDGNIKMRVFVEGRDPVEISPSSNPPVPFVTGKRYVVQVRAFSGGDKVPYRVNLELG